MGIAAAAAKAARLAADEAAAAAAALAAGAAPPCPDTSLLSLAGCVEDTALPVLAPGEARLLGQTLHPAVAAECHRVRASRRCAARPAEHHVRHAAVLMT